MDKLVEDFSRFPCAEDAAASSGEYASLASVTRDHPGGLECSDVPCLPCVQQLPPPPHTHVLLLDQCVLE